MNELAELSTARANAYGFLAGIYHSEPSTEFLKSLGEPEGVAILEAFGLSLAEVFEGTSDVEQLAEGLAIEYSRLFIGPGSHISPHESVHVTGQDVIDGELWGKATVAVKKFMAAAHIEVNDKFGGMPDHISAELEFMQQLAQLESEAWTAKNNEIASNIMRVQKRFYDEHLSRWVGNFCDKVVAQAEYPFYAKFAQATKDFIEFEGDNLKDGRLDSKLKSA